jgi:hypothetical protein
MRILVHIVGVALVAVLWWMAIWKFLGQDLNAFARQIIPSLSVATVVPALALSGIVALVYWLISKRQMTFFPVVLWSIWILVTLGFTILMTAVNG